MEQEQIIYFSKDICVSVRSTEKHLLEEKLQIFCWQWTDRMENLIIFHVSAGGEMQDMLQTLM